MDKFIALFSVALGAVYSDLGAEDLFGKFLFPLLFIAGIAYLFWFKGLLAITFGSVAAYYSDISSTSIMQSILLPLFIVFCMLYLLFWLYEAGLFDNDNCGGGDGGSDCGGFSGCDGGGGD
ncbi:MAG: hypothetical protein K0U40_05210 [Betaproteobacteria bacterium]|nr:hypothetical protein [Betaproteobacteria bacterium]